MRALLISLAIVTLSAGSCAAQAPAPSVEGRSGVHAGVGELSNDVNTKQPNPHSNSAVRTSSGEDSAAENELLAAANKSREIVGAPPLRRDESLREAALTHARRMIESERLEHQLFGEPS